MNTSANNLLVPALFLPNPLRFFSVFPSAQSIHGGVCLQVAEEQCDEKFCSKQNASQLRHGMERPRPTTSEL
jgi:hypothetical protein